MKLMKIIVSQQKAKGSLSICKVILRHSRFTGCLARDQNLPTVSVIKSTERFICERKLSPRMTSAVFRLYMAYTLELRPLV